MNYRGSYRRLIGNSTSAVVGAIEIYNKPRFEYRDEVFVELLINGWELFLKAVISKSGGSIYYRKKRNEPYRTLSLDDAFRRASRTTLWPTDIGADAVGRNLEFLSTFRDNAVHFYNAAGFGSIVYLLAQTSIANYHDLLLAIFGSDLSEEITWQLLPLGLRSPIDPVRYLAGERPPIGRPNTAVDEYLRSLSEATKELEDTGGDAGRFVTIYDVHLSSVKKLEAADIVVGVAADVDERVLVTRKLDPNRSHPYRFKRLMAHMSETGVTISEHEFHAIAWKHNLRQEQRYCWKDEDSGLVKWSGEVVGFVRRLDADAIETAVREYRQHLRRIQVSKRTKVGAR